MEDVRNKIEALFDVFYMNNVLLSYIVNDEKNFKGFLIKRMSAVADEDTLIITGNGDIEIIYPLSLIKSMELIHEKTLIINTLNDEQIIFTLI